MGIIYLLLVTRYLSVAPKRLQNQFNVKKVQETDFSDIRRVSYYSQKKPLTLLMLAIQCMLSTHVRSVSLIIVRNFAIKMLLFVLKLPKYCLVNKFVTGRTRGAYRIIGRMPNL
jgi:hypothetical protein